ncbi:Uncharacterized protein FWK35_00009731 [Aphis craccivora]|uniref:Uncharacterized protein n=1 Tax=Aphis craccivora TaxID=307492 RepID=A0A6G0ZNY6_APHCR|nr:Uncharacterized protein FWK35_00009731 [Aphis craccivora]
MYGGFGKLLPERLVVAWSSSSSFLFIFSFYLKHHVEDLDIIIEEQIQYYAIKRKRTDEDEESIIWKYENKKPRYK